MHPHNRWKSILIVLIALICALPLTAQQKTEITLAIRVSGARNTKGTVSVRLFRGPDGFPADGTKAFQVQTVKIETSGNTAHCIFSVPKGEYAVAVFHDENGNGMMDKNLIGVPKEGYGFSNNPGRKMRPATFDEARFRAESNQSVDVKACLLGLSLGCGKRNAHCASQAGCIRSLGFI
jgi:uncharacterized protein (DUF2141 family)